jgi:hypothetical protein
MEVRTTGLLAWLFRGSPSSRERLPHARRLATEELDQLDFVCSTCGRTDLPEAGDWDPPICLECDAAINFDVELEDVGYDDEDYR